MGGSRAEPLALALASGLGLGSGLASGLGLGLGLGLGCRGEPLASPSNRERATVCLDGEIGGDIGGE